MVVHLVVETYQKRCEVNIIQHWMAADPPTHTTILQCLLQGIVAGKETQRTQGQTPDLKNETTEETTEMKDRQLRGAVSLLLARLPENPVVIPIIQGIEILISNEDSCRREGDELPLEVTRVI
ncbi:BA75_02123T0 [Komagataella pastoris]|uniref:BA75_02123T0 n=1 Tax=Komagataella pastoris TaxID=4922 RepID=A0A1B2JBZ4_PICPA|nr:BA75_02123T0 [Komagataella pastoris]